MATINGAGPASDCALNGAQKDTPGKRPSSRNHQTKSTAPKSWRSAVDIHPVCAKFAPISDVELRALGEDIKANGLRERVAVLSSAAVGLGKKPMLLDGANRLSAMEMVGLPLIEDGRLRAELYQCVDGTVDDVVSYIISANILRRHLTTEQKRDLIAAVLKAAPEKSDLAVAKITKTSDKTVTKVRTKLERRSEIPNVSTRTDTKGRKQPAKKAATNTTNKPAVVAEKAVSAEAPSPVAAAPDEELALLREFATFVIGKARVTVDVPDNPGWRRLLDRAKSILGQAS